MDDLWYPPSALIEESNVVEFMRKHGIDNYKKLIKRSVEDIEWFWTAVADELKCEWFKTYDKVIDIAQGTPWTKWYVDGRINVTQNAVDRHVESNATREKNAFIWSGENGDVKKYSYIDLYSDVNRFANGLTSLDVKSGDVVASYMPMLPETVITLFATLKIGAIFLPIFSGFGSSAVAARLSDSGAKILVTADGTYRRGKNIDLKRTADEALNESRGVAQVVVTKRTGAEVSWVDRRDIWWSDLCKEQPTHCVTVDVNSEHPALLLYTSGTTGRPKGAIISHVGALLQPAKEIYFNLDFKDGNILSWITDIGWMMGPWQIIGCQHLGGTHVIFEGSPDYPIHDRVWSMIDEFGITHLGGSATVFRLLKNYGDDSIKKHNLRTLRAIGNTGELLDNNTWQWLLKVVGREKCFIINLSGGTEIFGCFVLPLPIMPLKPSTVGGPGLGMDVEVFNDAGKPVRGQIGYLVCRKPFPSMTRGFWNDPDRYIDTYWSKWPNVWYHGDWASVDADGFWFLHGRVDDVIKIAGRRLGPSEVEFIIDQHPSVRESAAIGRTNGTIGEELICFVSLSSNNQPSEELKNEIIDCVANSIGRPFKPSDIVFVSELPRNRAGKIMRRIIRAAALGKVPEDLSVVENPESVDEICKSVKP